MLSLESRFWEGSWEELLGVDFSSGRASKLRFFLEWEKACFVLIMNFSRFVELFRLMLSNSDD